MLEIEVLGPLQVRRDGQAVAIASGMQSRILHALACWGHVSTDHLIDIVWDGRPPATAESTLQAHVSRLRAAIGKDAVRTRQGGYELGKAVVDLHRFRALCQSEDPADAERALQLVGGPALQDVADLEAFAGERRALGELVIEARLRRGTALLESGDPERAVADLEQLVVEEPLREPAWSLLARALHAGRRQADAIAAVDRYRATAAEAGLTPSEEFTSVEELVFSPPSRPPPRADGRVGVRPRRSRFVGRADELADIAAALSQHRLVTLIGPGGMGKTRLAEEVALRMTDDRGMAVVLVELATTVDPDAVPNVIARAFGVRTAADPMAAVAAAIGSQTPLVVVDNCEHLREAAAAAIDRLLDESGTVAVLATSREPLRLEGEAVIPVGPLAEATDLFADRAALADPRYDATTDPTVEELCRRLDAMPLAIEMAASRVRSMSTTELLAVLQAGGVLQAERGVERHRTLEGLLAWSYDLLAAEDRRILRALGIFAAGFGVEDAATVTGLTTLEVGDALARLTDRSMLTARRGEEETEYSLLEVLRRFACARLEAAGELASVADAHLDRMVALTQEAGGRMAGADEARWARLIKRRIPDIAAAHARAVEVGSVDRQLRLLRPLFSYLYLMMPAGLAELGERTIELHGDDPHPDLPAVLAFAALGAVNRGDLDRAKELVDRALAHPAAAPAWEPLYLESDIALYEGRLEDAHAINRRLIVASAGAEHTMALGSGLICEAMVAAYSGRIEDAVALADQAVEDATRTGSPSYLSLAEYAAGEARHEFEPEAALEHLRRACRHSARIDNRLVEVVARTTIASTLGRLGRTGEAVSEFAVLIESAESAGLRTHLWTALRNLILLLTDLEAWADAALLLGATTDRMSPTYGTEAQRLESAGRILRRHLGDEFDGRFAEGVALSPTATVQAARTALAALV